MSPSERTGPAPGNIVVLNGAPFSGKSSIVREMQAIADEPWLNLGVDVFAGAVTPERYQPGIGLRPGGERPDLERWIPVLYMAMYDSIAAHSRHGLNVAVDVDHHDRYSRPLGILRRSARQLSGLPMLFVGVQCPVDVIVERRWQSADQHRQATGEEPRDRAERWENAVHDPGLYDLEVDTSSRSPAECAVLILEHVAMRPYGSAFASLADLEPGPPHEGA
jgi:chloramphenicol 3-O phosphotransferase